MIVISSRSNPAVKDARALQNKKYRDESGLHFIEGGKLVKEALASGVKLATVFVREGAEAPADTGNAAVFFVTESVMESLCTAGTPQSVCAAAYTPALSSPAEYSGLVLLCDRVQDPGNMGTVIRSADAFGASAVVFSPDCADPFSTKALRASMGSAYHLPLVCAPVADEIKKLQAGGYACFCGHLRGSETLPRLGKNNAFVVGNEGQGVSEEVASLCYRYRLPMPGRAESLNAAAFASVMLYILSSGVAE